MSATAMSPAAQKVLEERYLQPGEGWGDLCWRVAKTVSKAEHEPDDMVWAQRFYDLMYERKFIPGSPILSNAGKSGMCYSSCFVLPIEDDMSSIMQTASLAAIVHKAGGGTGFSFSSLRPKNAVVSSAKNGVASGPVSFMWMYDKVTQVVTQGGTRRGANMGILRVSHPDILEFIDCKRDGGITNFNISVGITDEFMADLQNAPHTLWTVTDPHTMERRLLTELDGETHVSVGALWQRICDAAHATGDPGVVFLDRMNASPANPIPTLGPIRATNPCGEQPLYDYDVCNLGSINLGKYVSGHIVEWSDLNRDVYTAMRFLDDVIDINNYPDERIEWVAKNARRVGLGVMGLHDMLMRLGIAYGSEEGIDAAEQVAKAIHDAAHQASSALAEERGNFPLWDQSIFCEEVNDHSSPVNTPMRNSTCTTIAPTGTISIIADASSGIEPIFAREYEHNNQQGRSITIRNWVYEESLNSGYVPEHGMEVFAEAHEIAPVWHVQMQAAWQRYTDNAVSKTINLPHTASVADIDMAYRMAWETGCLGVTVYRDGSKGAQVLNKPLAAPLTSEHVADLTEHYCEYRQLCTAANIKTVPDAITGTTYKVKSPDGTVNVTINRDTDGPIEVFVNVGRAGTDIAALAEAVGRLCSLVLRTPSGIGQSERLRLLADQLRNLGGSRSIGFGAERVSSVPDAVGRALDRHLQQFGSELSLVSVHSSVDVGGVFAGARPDDARPMAGASHDLCPACGNTTLIHEEGCAKCHGCGFSEC